MATIYATAQEFLNHPTGLNVANLVSGGTQQAQTAELELLMRQASSQVDQWVYQPLYAHQKTETRYATPPVYGTLRVRVKDGPLLQVVQAQSRSGSYDVWHVVPSAQITIIGPRDYVADDVYYSRIRGNPPFTVQTMYAAGYANALLTSNVAQGSTSISLDDVTGIQDGDTMTIYDGVSQESVQVSSVLAATTPTVVSGVAQYPGTVTIATPTLYAHGTGVRVSELPDAVSLAAIYACAWLIKERRAGGSAIMGGHVQPMNVSSSEDMQLFRELLMPFRRVI